MAWDDRIYRWRWWLLALVGIVLGLFLGFLPSSPAEAREWLETILGAFNR